MRELLAAKVLAEDLATTLESEHRLFLLLEAEAAARTRQVEKIHAQELAAAQQAIRAAEAESAALAAQVAALYSSESWLVTAPLRSVATTVRRLGRAGRRTGGRVFQEAPLPRRWKERLRDILLKPLAALPALEENHSRAGGIALPAPAAVIGSEPDVFIWAIIDWHFRIQRPQHLARELANQGHRVFYFSGHFIDSAEPGFRIEDIEGAASLQVVYLHVSRAPSIYFGMPDRETKDSIAASLAAFLQWAESRSILSVIQHPFWKDFAETLPNRRLVYDLMDHHAGFADNAADVVAAEEELMRSADHMVVTSSFLEDVARAKNATVSVIRNAGEYSHFADAPDQVFEDDRGRRVIGYYGAISDWFDVELVEKVAQAHPDELVLLIGADTTGAQKKLARYPNVEMTGEVPYTRLPFYLHGFDVCILPFRVIPLTLATNPVKVYEYLSAGKPVVSVDLPEIAQFSDLVAKATHHDGFLALVDAALRDGPDAEAIAARRRFASEQTWAHRVSDLRAALSEARRPRASIIVVTYNNLVFTQECLSSLESHTEYPNFEVIVVDNGSIDGTPDFLTRWAEGAPNRSAILNDDNKGFAAANNQGLRVATGEYLVLLNNDTFVTPGWLGSLIRHLARDSDLGLVGPVTNNIGNEARVDICYSDMDEMRRRALAYTSRHLGALYKVSTVAFFCAAMTRSTYEAIGDLDEAFAVGFFEDDDYCRRVGLAGKSVAIAEDVFIHHHLSASFDALAAERRREIFEQNRKVYEAKWGGWTVHQYRHLGR
jgi:GT2 family glycosyltransferase/glycosyltransferase involved in cell wall biosynthesis